MSTSDAAIVKRWRAKLAAALKRLAADKAAADAARKVIARHNRPLRERAYVVAETLVGVMEQGGNNTGPMVDKIIRENGGAIGESWCGDFVAYCYRHAGSKRVQRAWAAVRLIRNLFGVKATTTPHRGDLVRFDFEGPGSLSHVGLFVRHVSPGVIETIEGNTGRVGAVSDSKTGGDGVYRKHRSTSLVHDYIHVLG